MTWRLILCFILINNVFASERDKTRIVNLEEGGVIGTKYWDGDFYEFFSIPYAEAPKGRNRYQAPLPVKPRQNLITADDKSIVCHQSYYNEDEGEEFVVSGEDDCLVVNLYVPDIASEDNILPVVVYIHSGAYAGGNGNMARFHYLARHDIIVISFNYRLGALGFACLGNKEIPGNAGLKDQVAALKWIKKNVEKFGGDPNKITLAGFSVGASMAELLTLSKTTNGLIDQLILDSASALSPFAIDRDPIGTAKNLALAMGYDGTENLEELTEFYLNVSADVLAGKSLNFFLPNSTFGFAPCIENIHKGIEPVLTESPIDILRNVKKTEIPVLIGFSNMEGISRTIKFGEWRERMTKDFSDFLPADLIFDSEETKQAVITEIKLQYFKGEQINHEKLQNYIDYFSDAMFKYSIMKSLRLRAATSNKNIYLYEFSYVGKLNMQHNYMDKITGASHRDQTAYILDFFGWTNSNKDLDMRDRMTIMWADFVKYGDPTAYESAVVTYKWLPYTNENKNYLQINKKPSMKKSLFTDGYHFWNKLYEKYYWNPKAPEEPKVQNKQTDKTNNSKNSELSNDAKNIVHKDKEIKNTKVSNEKQNEGKKVKETSKFDKTNNVEEINKVKETNEVKKTNEGKETNEVKKTNEGKETNKVKETTKVKETAKVKETTKVKETNKVKKTNEVKKETKLGDEIKKTDNNIEQNNIKEKNPDEEVNKKINKNQQVKDETKNKDNQIKQEPSNKKKSVKDKNKTENDKIDHNTNNNKDTTQEKSKK